MSKREMMHNELTALYDEGVMLLGRLVSNEIDFTDFGLEYQRWYTKALRVVHALAPDRYSEFCAYYQADRKRANILKGTCVIQDYLNNMDSIYCNVRDVTKARFNSQLTILGSLEGRIDSLLSDIEGELYAELQDSEIDVARRLMKVSLRAAGALVGVLIEGHLQKVASSRGVKVTKKNPTIADLNDPLKAADIIDTPTWRKITLLGDLRNLCSHKKEKEPTKEQVEELIEGAEWLIKSVF